jgi:23S rRNA pseudouridine2605 synthase
VHYGPIEATLDREQGANVWLTIGIREGKNREVRKVLETLDLQVNRLIRVAFGPFELGDLDDSEVKEIESQALRTELGEKIVAEAGADFDAPLIDHDAPPRHPEVRAQRASKGDGRSSFEARQSRAPQDDGSTAERGRDHKKQPRRDRTGGPRPKYPRQK